MSKSHFFGHAAAEGIFATHFSGRTAAAEGFFRCILAGAFPPRLDPSHILNSRPTHRHHRRWDLSPDRTFRTCFRTFPDIPDMFSDMFSDTIGHHTGHQSDINRTPTGPIGHKSDSIMCAHVQNGAGHSGHNRTFTDTIGHSGHKRTQSRCGRFLGGCVGGISRGM